jgi:hypothetical protein
VIAGRRGPSIGMSDTTAASAACAAVLAQQRRQARAADLLLALEQARDVDRQLAAGAQVGLDGRDVRQQLALVVRGAPTVEGVAADRRGERRRAPGAQRLGRLHVVVAVDEQRGPFAQAPPARAHDGMAPGGDHPRVGEADAPQAIGRQAAHAATSAARAG